MFWKKKTKSEQGERPEIAGMRNAIEKLEDTDPFARAKATSADITANIMEMLKDDRGVRIEDALAVAGSLAGFSASFAMMDDLANNRIKAAIPDVAILTLKSGELVMAGDYINRRLISGENVGGQKVSLYSMVGGMAEQLGNAPDFDVMEIVKRTIATAGDENFGELDLPAEHRLLHTPLKIVRSIGPSYIGLARRYGLPTPELFLSFALSAQELMTQGKDVLSPSLATEIVMNCAYIASKLNPIDVMKAKAA